MDIGDKVLIVNGDGTEDAGTIEVLSSSTLWHMGSPSIKIEYGVKIANEKYIRYFKPEDLRLDVSSIKLNSCSCGAIKAALPYKPSGHAYYCDIKDKS